MRVLAAAIAIGLIGRSVELTLPLVLSSAQVEFALTNFDLGLFAMAEVLGVTVASASSFLWVSRFSPFTVVLAGLVAFAVGNVATPFVPPEWLFAVRFLTACFGEGLLLVVATATIGLAQAASRVYSIYMASQMIFGALLLAAQGYLAAGFGLLGIMLGFTVLSVVSLLALPAFSRTPAERLAGPKPRARDLPRKSALVLAGMGTFHVGVGGAWAFLQQRGAQHGLDFTDGGWALAGIMASGLIGNMLAVVLGRRAGFLPPLLCGAAGLGVGGAVAGLSGAVLPFVMGGVVLMIAWNLAVPYQIALLAAHERSPSHLALVPACQGAGLAAGPMLVGLATTGDDYTSIAVLSVAAAVVTAALLVAGRSDGARS